MSYPCKPLTRANSNAAFNHILSLFDPALITPIMLSLANEGIISLLDLIAADAEDMLNLEYNTTTEVIPLSRSETRLVKMIHSWVIWENITHPGIDFQQLIMDDYDAYLMAKATISASPAPVPTMAPLPVPMTLLLVRSFPHS